MKDWHFNKFVTFFGFVFRLQRLVKDLLKQLQGQDSGQWANNKVSGLDRTLGEISRILEKQVEEHMCNTDTLGSVLFFSFTVCCGVVHLKLSLSWL